MTAYHNPAALSGKVVLRKRLRFQKVVCALAREIDNNSSDTGSNQESCNFEPGLAVHFFASGSGLLALRAAVPVLITSACCLTEPQGVFT